MKTEPKRLANKATGNEPDLFGISVTIKWKTSKSQFLMKLTCALPFKLPCLASFTHLHNDLVDQDHCCITR